MPPLEWGSWGWVHRAATAVTMAGCTLTNLRQTYIIYWAMITNPLSKDSNDYYGLWLNTTGGHCAMSEPQLDSIHKY